MTLFRTKAVDWQGKNLPGKTYNNAFEFLKSHVVFIKITLSARILYSAFFQLCIKKEVVSMDVRVV